MIAAPESKGFNYCKFRVKLIRQKKVTMHVIVILMRRAKGLRSYWVVHALLSLALTVGLPVQHRSWRWPWGCAIRWGFAIKYVGIGRAQH